METRTALSDETEQDGDHTKLRLLVKDAFESGTFGPEINQLTDAELLAMGSVIEKEEERVLREESILYSSDEAAVVSTQRFINYIKMLVTENMQDTLSKEEKRLLQIRRGLNSEVASEMERRKNNTNLYLLRFFDWISMFPERVNGVNLTRAMVEDFVVIGRTRKLPSIETMGCICITAEYNHKENAQFVVDHLQRAKIIQNELGVPRNWRHNEMHKRRMLRLL